MMLRRTILAIAGATVLATAGIASAAKDGVWNTKKPAEWSLEEVREIITKSPWVQTVEVLPTTIRDPNAGTEKPVTGGTRVGLYVRWYSAGLIRQATVRGAQLAGGVSEAQAADMTKPIDRFYVISVTAPESLSVLDGVPFETVKGNTSLTIGETKHSLVNLVTPKQTGGPEALYFFERGKGAPADAKKAEFVTKIGEADIKAKFDVSKMVWNGKRDLDGDTGALSADEKRRRDVQAAILSTGDEALARAITDVRVENRAKKIAVYVFYDPNRELANPAEAKNVDIGARKLAMTKALGKYSTDAKTDLDVVIFADPNAGKAVDYILGNDAEKIAKLEGDAAAKMFKEKLQKADDAKDKKKDEGKKPEKSSSEAAPHPNAPAKASK